MTSGGVLMNNEMDDFSTPNQVTSLAVRMAEVGTAKWDWA
jgi:hypothetical protein